MKKPSQRKSWHRLVLSLLGVVVVAGMWRWATYHLYALPEHSISAFTSLTTNAFYTISAIIIFMVTGRLVYDWKNNTTSTIEEKTEEIFQHSGRRDPKDFDDESIP